MKSYILPHIVFGLIAFWSGFAARATTPADLQPYLEYPPLQTYVGVTAGTGGPSHAVLVMDLDPGLTGKRSPSIIFSEYRGAASSVVAFDGAVGTPLIGWGEGMVHPVGNAGGYAHLSGSMLPFPRIAAAFLLKPALVLSESGATLGQFSIGSTQTSAVAFGGYAPTAREELGALYFGAEDRRIHKVRLRDFFEASGWPKLHATGNQRVTTPAVMDINGDELPEVFSVSGGASGGFELKAVDGRTNLEMWSRHFEKGFVANHVVVGQVFADAAPELAILHGLPLSRSTPQLSILDALTGSIEITRSLPGTLSKAPPPALADLDGDGLDDVIVATQSTSRCTVSAVGGVGFTQLAGMPVDLGVDMGLCGLGDSAPIVGDLGGEAGFEIVVTTATSLGSIGVVHIINQNGSYMIPRQRMTIGGGVTNAIYDLDGDGHNELIIAGRPSGGAALQDSIWVFDFSRNATQPVVHGGIPWGQFGQNAERCNCSLLVQSSL